MRVGVLALMKPGHCVAVGSPRAQGWGISCSHNPAASKGMGYRCRFGALFGLCEMWRRAGLPPAIIPVTRGCFCRLLFPLLSPHPAPLHPGDSNAETTGRPYRPATGETGAA